MSTRAWLGTIVVLALSNSAVQESSTSVGAIYTNDVWRFSMTPPAFKKESSVPTCAVVQFYGPPEKGFSPNVNVMVQRASFEDFVAATDVQLKTPPFSLVSKKEAAVGAHAACEYVYKGQLQGQRLQFLALAVDAGNHVLLATGTALEDGFADQETIFRQAFATLKLAD